METFAPAANDIVEPPVIKGLRLMLKRLIVTALFLFSVSCAASLQLSKYPDVLLSDSSLQATVVKEKSGEQALVQIKGIDHELDGVVFRTDISSRGEDTTAYETTIDGETRALLVKNKRWGNEHYTVYLPDGTEKTVQRDKEESESFDTSKLLSTFEQQKEEGVQESLAEFDREENEEAHQNQLADLDKAASEACNSSVETNVDWDTVNDKLLKDVSISGYCGVVVSQMEKLCSANDDFTEQVNDIDAVDCGFGESLKLKRDGSTLNFSTGKSEPNQQDFARQFLRNL